MRLLIVLLPAMLLAGPSFASSDDYEAAGMRLAIANVCRAFFGEDDLFEASFAEFAAKAQHLVSDAELREARQQLLAMEPNPDDPENFFARGFCDALRAGELH